MRARGRAPKGSLYLTEADAEESALCPLTMEALDTLRSTVEERGLRCTRPEDSDFLEDRKTLLRFVIGAGHDCARAANGLEQHVAWRNRVGPRQLGKADVPTLYGSNALRLLGHSDGMCVMLLQAKALKHVSTSSEGIAELEAYVALEMEEGIRRMLPGASTQLIFVADLRGMRLFDSSLLSNLRTLIQLLQDNYPERLSKALLINAGTLLSVSFRMLRPFIDPRTRTKIAFTNAQGLRPFLGDHLVDTLPS